MEACLRGCDPCKTGENDATKQRRGAFGLSVTATTAGERREENQLKNVALMQCDLQSNISDF